VHEAGTQIPFDSDTICSSILLARPDLVIPKSGRQKPGIPRNPRDECKDRERERGERREREVLLTIQKCVCVCERERERERSFVDNHEVTEGL
jgi:hypothetical protein